MKYLVSCLLIVPLVSSCAQQEYAVHHYHSAPGVEVQQYYPIHHPRHHGHAGEHNVVRHSYHSDTPVQVPGQVHGHGHSGVHTNSTRQVHAQDNHHVHGQSNQSVYGKSQLLSLIHI